MGYDQVQGSIVGRVSRHNSERDDDDNALWNEMTDRLRTVLADPKYNEVVMDYSFDELPRERQWTDD